MANTPFEISVSLNFHELQAILQVLKDTRSNSDFNVEREDFMSVEYWTNPDTNKYEPKLDSDGAQIKRIHSYTVEGAESALTRRQELADLIYRLSGEVVTEKPETASRVAQARVDFDAQEAARKATEEV